MTLQSAINELQAADAICSLSFYVLKSDNKGPELRCRIFDDCVKFQSEANAERLARELNEAIKPVIRRWETGFFTSACKSLDAYQSGRRVVPNTLNTHLDDPDED